MKVGRVIKVCKPRKRQYIRFVLLPRYDAKILTRRSCFRGLVYTGGLYRRRHRFDSEIIFRARIEIVGDVICGDDCGLIAGILVALFNRVIGYTFCVYHRRLPIQQYSFHADVTRTQIEYISDFRN